MLLFFILSLAACAEDFNFHAMEDSEVRLGVECIPESVKARVMANEKSLTIQKTSYGSSEGEGSVFEKRYYQLANEREISKACGLEGIQAYFDGKLYPLSNTQYFKYTVSEKDDCGYSVPRLDVAFQQNPFRETFLLGAGFKVLNRSERKKAEKDFKAAKGFEWKFGYARDYFSRKGKIFLVFDESEMGTKLVLYRLQGKKAEKVAWAEFEPCGS